MNDSHEQPVQETVSTDEGASTSTPSPTPPGNSAPTNLICSFCDKKLQLDKHKKCPCKTTFYCMNSGCQKKHWKVHKPEHRKIEKALDPVKKDGEKDDDKVEESDKEANNDEVEGTTIV